ncbi:MAG TPA: GTPase HflX [Candidatus Marinimicrobia bacterium]|nr:GTPase HflX [Candidatus Neomarinimicrobiota bacterium]
MTELLSVEAAKERAILVAIALPGQKGATEKSLTELQRLTETAGAEVLDLILQSRPQIDKSLYLGKGKLQLLKLTCEELKADLVIFDDELTPSQQKAIQRQIKSVKIMDRSSLILYIFKQHAKTREAKTQVELATLEYELPRLTRQWTHLERQVGGINVRGGMGETQIEIDRRLIRQRIKKLKEELEKISVQRDTQRKFRDQRYNVSLVGYTNAGKSTLMNQLTEAGVLVKDKLFATLDTTVRQVQLDKQHTIYLSDTVGFIQKLPHQLVASFRSTLQETAAADLLLKIIDISDGDFRLHIKTINETLANFEIPSKRYISIFNKTDIIPDGVNISLIKKEFPDAIFISAARGIGLDKIIEIIIQRMDSDAINRHIRVQNSDGKLIAQLHQFGKNIQVEKCDDWIDFRLRLDEELWNRLKKEYVFEDLSAKGKEN